MSSTLTKPSESIASTTNSNFLVCVVDDEPAMVELLRDSVRTLGYDVIGTSEPLEALAHVKSGRCRVVISDIKMPSMDGRDLLDQALKFDPGVHVILMTGYYSLDAAVDAIRRGAADYLSKPFDRARLKKTLDEIGELFNQRQRIRELEGQLLEDANFHGIIGKSPVMLEVFDLVRKVAKHYTNVLISGQTGTGKELVAQALHQLSPNLRREAAIRIPSRRLHGGVALAGGSVRLLRHFQQ